jgi:DNA-binding response OmpR family regulator
MDKKKILIVEDNTDLSLILKKRFEISGYEADVLIGGLDVVKRLSERANPPDAIILDLMLPGRTGYELINGIKSVWPWMKVFIFTSHDEYRYKIPSRFIDGYFIKTDGSDKLIAAVNEGFGK